MFCPKCKAEYVEGVRICADCGTVLVSQLAMPEPPHWIEYEEILATFNAGDIALIKSILDAEEITYYFKDEAFNYVQPLVQRAKLMVRKDLADQAREILKDLELDYTIKGGVEEPTKD